MSLIAEAWRSNAPLFVHTTVEFSRFESGALLMRAGSPLTATAMKREWDSLDRVVTDAEIESDVIEDWLRARRLELRAARADAERKDYMEGAEYKERKDLHGKFGVAFRVPEEQKIAWHRAWQERFQAPLPTSLLRSSKALRPEEKEDIIVLDHTRMRAHFRSALEACKPTTMDFDLAGMEDLEELRLMLPLERLPEDLLHCIHEVQDKGDGGLATKARIITYPAYERPAILSFG